MLSFTLECSFFGKTNPEGKLVHMSIIDYESLGKTLTNVLFHYLPNEQF